MATPNGKMLRHIFVEDGAQWFHHLFISKDGPENIRVEEARRRVLDTFVEPLLSTAVEGVTYRICQGNHFLFYDSKVAQCLGDTVELLDRYPFAHRSKQIYSAEGPRGLWNTAENFRRFREVGWDPHAAIIERLHEAGKKAFIKTRINDTHVGGHRFWFDYAGSRTRGTDDFFSHPELMLGYLDQRDVSGGFSLASDFCLEEVRNRRLAEIEEICGRYDLDGLEINFCRSYRLFKRNETDKGRELLTDFFRQMRRILDRLGAERGRRLQAIVRFHVSCDTERGYQDMEYEEGADIIRWMREELVDIVVPTVPVAASEGARYVAKYVEAAQGLACSVFAGTRNPNHDDLALRPITKEILRAQIRSYESVGVDGVYHWWPRIDAAHANWELLKEIGDPPKLAAGDTHYIASENLPIPLSDGSNTVPFLVTDDLLDAEAKGMLGEVRLRLRFLHLRPGDELEWKVNGETVPRNTFRAAEYPSEPFVSGRLDAILSGATLPIRGDNMLTISVKKRDAAAAKAPDDRRRLGELILRNVELTVRYKGKTQRG